LTAAKTGTEQSYGADVAYQRALKLQQMRPKTAEQVMGAELQRTLDAKRQAATPVPPANKLIWKQTPTPQGVVIQNPATGQSEVLDKDQTYQVISDDGTKLTLSGAAIKSSSKPVNIVGKFDPNTIKGNAIAMGVSGIERLTSFEPGAVYDPTMGQWIKPTEEKWSKPVFGKPYRVQ
jgi:hypothetical protein